MTRAARHIGTQPTGTTHAWGGSPATFTVRELVAYDRLIVGRERVDPETVVREFIRANPDTDLEARATVSDWQAGVRPGDTAERTGGFRL